MRTPFFSRGRWLVCASLVLIVLSGCQSTSTSPPGSQIPAKPASTTGAVPEAIATMKARAQPAPEWMVGTFVGTNLRSGLQNISIDISPAGYVRGRIGDLNAEGQYIGSSRILWAHGNESVVEQRKTGFRVVQLKDPGNVTEYVRK